MKLHTPTLTVILLLLLNSATAHPANSPANQLCTAIHPRTADAPTTTTSAGPDYTTALHPSLRTRILSYLLYLLPRDLINEPPVISAPPGEFSVPPSAPPQTPPDAPESSNLLPPSTDPSQPPNVPPPAAVPSSDPHTVINSPNLYRVTFASAPPNNTHPHEGTTQGCSAWVVVQPGDTCQSLVDLVPGYLDMNDFEKWNPGVGKGCEGLWAGEGYCLGVRGG